jgi:hypothetical protein
MHRLWCLFALTLLAAPAVAQGPTVTMVPPSPAMPVEPCPVASVFDTAVAPEEGNGALRSNRNFPNFIGFMSNPLENIDPRALTQIQPLFLGSWVSATSALPAANAQVYGPAITVALTDRLAIGLNQGGYAAIHVDKNDPRGPLLNFLFQTRGQEFGGSRTGFLNTGGFVQYTLIEDVEDQFLLTAGLRGIAPIGSYEVFQGHGPAQLVPYVTVGKEFGQFHFLGTVGYQFPAGGGGAGLQLFNVNVHLDQQFFGWLYPLVEFNCAYHTENVPIPLPTRIGYFDLDNFSATGNVLTMAVGANAVLIRDRLEFGAVYTTAVATQARINVNGLLVKMTLRY